MEIQSFSLATGVASIMEQDLFQLTIQTPQIRTKGGE